MTGSICHPNRKTRRVAIALAAVAVALDHGALAFTQRGHFRAVGVLSSLASSNERTPILPETPPPTVERQKQPAKTKRRRNDVRFRERISKELEWKLPETIPRLSGIWNDGEGTRIEKRGSPLTREVDDDEAGTAASADGQAEPWKASFETSLRTQGRIKKEFSTFIQGESPNDKAKRVLRAFLSTPASQCNAANVVGALTFSAKALGARRIEPDEELRAMLFDTLETLNKIVKEGLLSTRQLCNACWAIAKHYDRDELLLPPVPEGTSLSPEPFVGKAERWDIFDEGFKLQERQQRVDETVDEIAQLLTLVLQECEETSKQDPPPLQAKIGEICMASWAYGKLRPRSTPPGWQIPPQLGRLPTTKNTVEKVARTTNLITFEQWGFFGDNKKASDELESHPSAKITAGLFDAIAASLCRSPEAVGIQTTTDDSFGGDEDFPNCLQHCSWSEIANVGWSFASHGRCMSRESQMLLTGLAREARHRLMAGGKATNDLLVRDIAQLLWALGTLQADNFRLADDLVDLVAALSEYLRLGERSPSFGRGRPLARWSCADLVQVALSLAHARIDELPLLRAIYEESHYRLLEGIHEDLNEPNGRQRFRPWEVSILLWGQARLYLKEEQGHVFEEFAADAPRFFLSSLSKERRSLLEAGIGAQEQANIVWSLTVLGEHQSKHAVALIREIFKEAAAASDDQQTIQLEHAHQLWQAFFLLQDESPEAVADVPIWFADYLRDRWTLEKSRAKLSSARHKSLSQTLSLMGVRHFNEHEEDIDVAIVLKGDASWTHETDPSGSASSQVSVAVEFDGPNHFTRERPGADRSTLPRALGHTVLKYRLLKKKGWSVVRVPYFEFDKIPFWASMERQRYLQRKLKTHANIKFSEVDISEYKALQPNRKSRFD